jgi:hypothetical protein
LWYLQLYCFSQDCFLYLESLWFYVKFTIFSISVKDTINVLKEIKYSLFGSMYILTILIFIIHESGYLLLFVPLFFLQILLFSLYRCFIVYILARTVFPSQVAPSFGHLNKFLNFIPQILYSHIDFEKWMCVMANQNRSQYFYGKSQFYGCGEAAKS